MSQYIFSILMLIAKIIVELTVIFTLCEKSKPSTSEMKYQKLQRIDNFFSDNKLNTSYNSNVKIFSKSKSYFFSSDP